MDILRSISKQSRESMESVLKGIHGVSFEEEKESYGGKDLQRRKVLSLGCTSEG